MAVVYNAFFPPSYTEKFCCLSSSLRLSRHTTVEVRQMSASKEFKLLFSSTLQLSLPTSKMFTFVASMSLLRWVHIGVHDFVSSAVLRNARNVSLFTSS